MIKNIRVLEGPQTLFLMSVQLHPKQDLDFFAVNQLKGCRWCQKQLTEAPRAKDLAESRPVQLEPC